MSNFFSFQDCPSASEQPSFDPSGAFQLHSLFRNRADEEAELVKAARAELKGRKAAITGRAKSKIAADVLQTADGDFANRMAEILRCALSAAAPKLTAG